MRADGYGWWIRRIGQAVKMFDVIRIDHFRGLKATGPCRQEKKRLSTVIGEKGREWTFGKNKGLV